jgi:hypothetical protein
VKHFVLPLSSSSNIFLRKASILEKESQGGAQPIPTLRAVAAFATM